MAAYDPKRPRPSASTPADDPAPVEALLDPTGPAPIEEPAEAPESVDAPTGSSVDAEAAAEATQDRPVDVPSADEPTDAPRVTDEPLVEEPAAVEADDPAPEPGEVPGIALNGSATRTSVAATGPAVSGRTASEVPVAPAPASGTANRAVLIAAAVSSIVAALVVVLLARRRRH